MTDPAPDAPQTQTGRRRFYGWRLVWVGAVILGIAGGKLGLPPIAGFLGDVQPESIGEWLLPGALLPLLLLPFIG